MIKMEGTGSSEKYDCVAPYLGNYTAQLLQPNRFVSAHVFLQVQRPVCDIFVLTDSKKQQRGHQLFYIHLCLTHQLQIKRENRTHL